MGPKVSNEQSSLKKPKRRLPVGDLMGNFSDKASFYTYMSGQL